MGLKSTTPRSSFTLGTISSGFGKRNSKIDGQPPLPRIACIQVRLDMPLDHPLMRQPAMAQLLQNLGLARRRHPARPFTVYPRPENVTGGKWQIDQLDPESVSGLETNNERAIMRFDSLAHSFTLQASRLCRGLPVHSIGAGDAPSNRPTLFFNSQKSKTTVHKEMYVPVYNISCT